MLLRMIGIRERDRKLIGITASLSWATNVRWEQDFLLVLSPSSSHRLC